MKTYRVEIASISIIPIEVEAHTIRDAESRALNNQGEAGESYPDETKVVSCVCLDED